MKNFFSFITENLSIDNYLTQVWTGYYEELSEELFDFISLEGWLVSIEEEFKEEYTIDDFEYLILDISNEDKTGLMSNSEETVEKFNKFDLELKKNQEYPFDTLDFIDYEKGVVYIIRLI